MASPLLASDQMPVQNQGPQLAVDNTIQQQPEMSHDDKQAFLKEILGLVQKDDRAARDRQLKECKKLEHMWRGDQNLFWSEALKDWRTQAEEYENLSLDEENDAVGDLKKSINILKANGEAIIAAMSASIPATRFFPADADDADDLVAAKAKGRIAELIENDNSGTVKLAKAIYILLNQHFVASYINHRVSKENGLHYEITENEVTTLQDVQYCPDCGLDNDSDICANCGVPTQTEQIPQTSFETKKIPIPKPKEEIELYGPLNVKIPLYAQKFRDCGYLLLTTDIATQQAAYLYPILADKIAPGTADSPNSETWGRRFYLSQADYEANTTVVYRLWLRPWMYCDPTQTDEKAILMEQMYPNGIYCVFVNNELAECHDESIDEYWELYENPLSNFLNATPGARGMVDIQEMTNDLYNLTIDVIKHEVPETFVDPRVIDFDEYGKTKAKAGLVFPAKSPDGSSPIASFFYERHPATLSQEVERFADRLSAAGQLILGAFPSIYGGQIEGSRTAKEYEISRTQALQRLSLTWKSISRWWSRTIGKAVELYIKSWPYDTVYAKPQGSGFVNVWIRQDELQGHTSKVEPEFNEDYPISWAEISDRAMQLLQLNNPQINGALFNSQNAGFLARLLGFSKAYIPGDDDRMKQLQVITELLKAQPNPDGSSSVPPEPIDDPQICMETDRFWLISPMGQDAKTTNPGGYSNVLANFNEHQMILQQKQMAQQSTNQPPQNGGLQNAAPAPES